MDKEWRTSAAKTNSIPYIHKRRQLDSERQVLPRCRQPLAMLTYRSARALRGVSYCSPLYCRALGATNPYVYTQRTLAIPPRQSASHKCDPERSHMKLEGHCSCGSTGWVGHGTSALNFTCHCSICRTASGRPALSAAAFKPHQVTLVNEEGIRRETPPTSRNPRWYCKSCGDYLGEDVTRTLGAIALPLHLCKDNQVHGSYRPNHHLFYDDRVAEAEDDLPKWKTIPQADPAPVTCEGYDPLTGQYNKDVLPFSPTRPADPGVYHFTEVDPLPNHVTQIPPDKIQERVLVKYHHPPPGSFVSPSRAKRDVIIVGGGHNGLVSAAYLAQKGLDVLVLERRHVLGGAAVTEELIPGFKFSRASYLAGLLRPQIISDLGLEKHGFKYLPRDPSSFTPTNTPGRYLMLGSDEEANWKSIAQFSEKDADAFPAYEEFLNKVREVVEPLLDSPPPNPMEGQWSERLRTLSTLKTLVSVGVKNREVLVPFYELFTAPASHILDRWFDSEILKATLATDAVIGAMVGPRQAGSAYVLLHHIMGEAAGRKGVWAYIEGGMGKVSSTIAQAAQERGAEIATNASVKRILFEGQKAVGVEMDDGTKLESKVVLSNCTPYHTFLELLPGLSRDSGWVGEDSPLPRDFVHHIRFADYSSGVFKMNLALDRLPNFTCCPSAADGSPGPQHRGTIHFEETVQEIEDAYLEAQMGKPSSRPVIEMTLPSSLDKTISPSGQHVATLFVQYAPYALDSKVGNWADERFKHAYADRILRIIDEKAPGFSNSIIGRDVLSPLDLERIFGLHKGNIFHGALSLHQLGYTRPAFGYSSHRTPLQGLYLCGAGAHPGGGVMGAAGRNCALVVMSDLGISS